MTVASAGAGLVRVRPGAAAGAGDHRAPPAAPPQQHLGERLALAGAQDELKELADTFDDMLERLDRRSPRSAGSSPTPRTSCARR